MKRDPEQAQKDRDDFYSYNAFATKFTGGCLAIFIVLPAMLLFVFIILDTIRA